MKDNPMISIYVATYNHERYIVQALDSIRAQKTKYTYEVLVGEDVSTDNTRHLLKQYEEQYPGFMTVYYRDHNMHLEDPNNAKDLKMRCKGKYIIALEGDDYWIDPLKLEKQVDFLESHEEYLAVAHRCVVVDENSENKNEKYQECLDTEYTLKHFVSGIMPGQLTTVMCRNYLREDLFDTSFANITILPGDRRLYFSLASNGKVYCIPDVMSAYRHVTSGGSSFSANIKPNFERNRKWHEAALDYAYKIEKAESIQCAELMYALEIRKGLFKKNISIKNAAKEFDKVKHKWRTLLLMFRRDWRHFVLKKNIWI